jgi:hypothetical protein
MKRTWILVMALAGFAPAEPARAQGTTGVIRGTVRAATGMPLERANVVLEGARVGGVTGADGRYTIRVGAGGYNLSGSRIG